MLGLAIEKDVGDIFCISIETLKPEGHILKDLQVHRKDSGHIDLI